MTPDTTIIRLRWTPTPAQLAAYRAREVELCAEAMAQQSTLRQADTMFSAATWLDAVRARRGKVMA